MTRAGSTDVQLDRAHLECKVIASSLEHVEMILREEDASLQDELKMFARTFGLYVTKLGTASGVACEAERTRQADTPRERTRETVAP